MQGKKTGSFDGQPAKKVGSLWCYIKADEKSRKKNIWRQFKKLSFNFITEEELDG